MNEDPAILLTPPGQELLARLAAEPDGGSLAVAERLRREYPAGLVATAMAQRELRLAAEVKFSRAAEMLFTRAGYEQSSSEAIARYRAGRLGHASRIADLCCGIGGDLIAWRRRVTWSPSTGTRPMPAWPCTTPLSTAGRNT